MNVNNRIPKHTWPSTSKGHTYVGVTVTQTNASSCSDKESKQIKQGASHN